ncbi:DUF5691 domain-containing protein [Nonomuraea sp. NPDC059194]|uniref:DUF5691 domain-containing protein n=1 Tax=Nonomuraea sp. NPDC059194 TaxID=3346764 RepID=UPI0036BFA4AB
MWEELVSAALVGTDRRPHHGDLLAAAAVELVRRRAGQVPYGERPPAPAPAREEEQEAVSPAAAARLGWILDGRHPRLLPEWLALAAATGRRVPPRLLPELLDKGARDRSIRPFLGVLAGRRGRWLAGLNPAWSYLLAEPTGLQAGTAESWELGGHGDRLAYLERLRASDPGAARRLLEQAWEKETPDDRAQFLALLGEGLSMADEPFLESVLDDRRREVRQQAADLLTRLPGSRLAGRMAERAAGCLAVRDDRIVVEPPAACDRGMERDGIRARPPRGTGERAWWLQQVVARAPLRMWDTALLRAKIPEWGREVRSGWVRAAVLQRDPVWARALFAWDPLADLLAVLPPDDQDEVAADFVHRHGVDGQMIMVLGGASTPWGRGLAHAVLTKIGKVAATQPWNLDELARMAGERIDPADRFMADGLSEVSNLLAFRAEMTKELR